MAKKDRPDTTGHSQAEDTTRSGAEEAVTTDTQTATTDAARTDDATATAPDDTATDAGSAGSATSGSSTTDSPGSSATPARGGTGPSFLMLLLGGFLAAALGYLAAYYGNFGLFAQDGGEEEEMAQIIASQEARLDEIEALLGAPDDAAARLDASDAGLAELQGSLGSLVGDLASLDERIGGVEAGISEIRAAGSGNASAFDPDRFEELSQSTDSLQSELQSRIDELSQQIASLEEAAQDDASQDQVASLEDRLSELGNRIDGVATAAEDEARRISAQGALSEIRAAIEVGNPYEDALGAYREASGEDLPQAITDPATDGVATLSDLQESFDAAARDALDASLSVTAGDGPLDRFGAFLRAQTGARSLDEREGTGPDAILSRAQARVGEGELRAALDELQALPQEGRDAMSGWIDRAQTRLEALRAASELSTNTNSN